MHGCGCLPKGMTLGNSLGKDLWQQMRQLVGKTFLLRITNFLNIDFYPYLVFLSIASCSDEASCPKVCVHFAHTEPLAPNVSLVLGIILHVLHS